MTDTNGEEVPTPVGQETVLVVEDDEGLRPVVIRQLKDLGYRLMEAQDGSSALRTLESVQVDLLFTDIVLPGGWSGYTIAKHASMRRPALKILFTSGFPETKLDGNDEVLSRRVPSIPP